MVDKLRGKYLFQKRGVYYFSKQIPKDVRQHYSQTRIVQSLKTKSVKDAFYQSQNLLHKLNQHWFYLRVKNENILLFPYQSNQQTPQKSAHNPKLSEALQTYFKLKGKGKGRQKMSIFTPFSIYSKVNLMVVFLINMAVAQW